MAQAYLIEVANAINIFGAVSNDPCPHKTFFGFPPWFKYLGSENSTIISPIDNSVVPVCTPHVAELNDFWLIGLAVIEILLRIAMLAAVFYVFYAGIKYTNSRGNADKIESAKKTLVDAIAGFVITVIATAVVSFIAKSFS